EKFNAEATRQRNDLRKNYLMALDELRKSALVKEDLDEAERIVRYKNWLIEEEKKSALKVGTAFTARDKPTPSNKPKSAAAVDADGKFIAELRKLDEEFSKRSSERRKSFMAELDEIMKVTLAKEDLDEAQRLLTYKKALQNEEAGQ